VKSATPAPAAKSAAPAPAAKSATPAPAVTPAAKPAAKKSAPKKKSASKKPAAKSAAKTPEKAPAKKAEPAKAKKVVLDKTDTVKKALWEAHSKTKAQKIESYMAVQVYVHDSEIDSFFIAVQDGAVKIERSHYQGNNGDLIFYGDDTELQKIAKGKYDFIDAISSGKMNYHGDLSVLVALMGLFV
jgi:putative sterol carrier protein